MPTGTTEPTIDGWISLHGEYRHLTDPARRQPPHDTGGCWMYMACGRRLWVVWDAQHDRHLCHGCAQWLSAYREKRNDAAADQPEASVLG